MVEAIDPDLFDVFTVFPEENESVFRKLQSLVQGIAVLDYSWWRCDLPINEAAVTAFERLIRTQGIDLVHVNTIMVRDPLIAAQRQQIPSVISARELISLDDDLSARLGGSPREIVNAVCESATHLLANSATTLAEFRCGVRGSFLYNSIDPQSMDLPNVVAPSHIEIGMVSSNIRKKGVVDFVRLAQMAKEAVPSLRFHLIGPETVLMKQLRRSAEGIPANLQMHDYVSPPGVAYRNLNIVINLSHFGESFGRTMAEAMMARRPVVAYRHGALPELIQEGETGFLVPYLNVETVLDRLRFFADDPGKIAQFGEAARRSAIRRFSPEKFRRELNRLYQRLIMQSRVAERG
jgi:glycosyltransferase involved in cell wall biosynthesis